MYCKVGNSKSNVDIPHKVKQLWRNMLNRCYNENTQKYKYYGGKGVRVSNDWLRLENFYNDIQLLDNYDIWLNNDRYSLDKDIKGNGLLYSKEYCIFTDGYKQNQEHDKVKRIKVYNDSYYKEFESLREIDRELGIYLTKLRRILNGECSNNTGYMIEYIE